MIMEKTCIFAAKNAGIPIFREKRVIDFLYRRVTRFNKGEEADEVFYRYREH